MKETTFLNVDLDLFASKGLKELVDAMGASVVIVNDETAGRISLELEIQPQSIDEAVLSFYKIIQNLPLQMLDVWNACEKRSMNIGIEAGTGVHSKEFQLSQSAISRLSLINAEVAITVYASHPK